MNELIRRDRFNERTSYKFSARAEPTSYNVAKTRCIHLARMLSRANLVSASNLARFPSREKIIQVSTSTLLLEPFTVYGMRVNQSRLGWNHGSAADLKHHKYPDPHYSYEGNNEIEYKRHLHDIHQCNKACVLV